MNVSTAISILRAELDDNSDNKLKTLWSDFEFGLWLKEALAKFCRDTLGISDETTIGEVKASAIVTLTGTSGQIDAVQVGGVPVCAPVQFDVDLQTTASDLASAINAAGLYSADASSGDGTVTIKAPPNTGATENGKEVVVYTSGGDLGADSVELGGGTSICSLFFRPGVSVYELDERVITVESIVLPGKEPLRHVTRSWLAQNFSNWRSAPAGEPTFYIEDEEPHVVTIIPEPATSATAKVHVYREPLNSPLKSDNSLDGGVSIEISDKYNEVIRFWVKRCALLKEDAETLRPEKAQYYADLYAKAVDERKRKLNRMRFPETRVPFRLGYL